MKSEHTPKDWAGPEYILHLRDGETIKTIEPTPSVTQDDVKEFVTKMFASDSDRSGQQLQKLHRNTFKWV